MNQRSSSDFQIVMENEDKSNIDSPLGAGLPCRILIVDDNEDAANSLSRLLRLSGNEILACYDGLDAVTIAAEFEPHVILLDIGLPSLNGHDVARRIRSLELLCDPVLIALSGLSQDDDSLQSKDSGFEHHLTKPVDLAELEELIAAIAPRVATKKSSFPR